MANTSGASAAKFRNQMVELVRAGRIPEELARKFEPSGQTIRDWLQRTTRAGQVRGNW